MIENKTERGYLVLADISGYTAYVARTELEHSQSVLTELLELIVSRLTPVLVLSKLEGDALFAYLPEAQLLRGETLLEIVESTYVAFRDRVEAVRRRTTCPCRACQAIPSLDLKFIVHFGEYMVQRISGIHEMVGSDVNLVHRLSKNRVSETTGWRGYALFTGQALERMGLRPDGLHEQVETYEHLGQVPTFSLDLWARYQALTAERRVVVTREQAHVFYVLEVPAQPAIVWEWLNDPQRRAQWMPGTTWQAIVRPNGRTGVGARNHCAHGKGEIIVENILDWRPFDYYTIEQLVTAGGKLAVVMTNRLEPTPGGTRLHSSLQFRTPLPGWATRLVARTLARMGGFHQSLQLMARLIGEDRREALVPEPELVIASLAG